MDIESSKVQICFVYLLQAVNRAEVLRNFLTAVSNSLGAGRELLHRRHAFLYAVSNSFWINWFIISAELVPALHQLNRRWQWAWRNLLLVIFEKQSDLPCILDSSEAGNFTIPRYLSFANYGFKSAHVLFKGWGVFLFLVSTRLLLRACLSVTSGSKSI